MENKEIEKTNSLSVSCAGRVVPFDHPRVYLEIKKEIGSIECSYCRKQFIFELRTDLT